MMMLTKGLASRVVTSSPLDAATLFARGLFCMRRVQIGWIRGVFHTYWMICSLGYQVIWTVEVVSVCKPDL